MVVASSTSARKPFLNPFPSDPPFIVAYGTLAELAAMVGHQSQFILRDFFQEQMNEGAFERTNIPLPGLPCPVLTIKAKTGGR